MPPRIHAIEVEMRKILFAQLKESVRPSYPAPPPNWSPVKIHRYYDLGFDPRATEDGRYFYQMRRGFLSRISGIFAYVVFFLKSRFSWSAEERGQRQSILHAASFERALSNRCHKVLVQEQIGLMEDIPDMESDFFDGTNRLLRSRGVFFDSALLQPFHRLNKPNEDQLDAKDIGIPTREFQMIPLCQNEDLASVHDWPFSRLERLLCAKYQIGWFEYQIVPHYLFCRAVAGPGEELKKALRTYRLALSETVTDWKCALSFAACLKKLEPTFADLTRTWKAYVESHELLKEADEIYRTRNSDPIPYFVWKDEDSVKWFAAETFSSQPKETPTVRFLKDCRNQSRKLG